MTYTISADWLTAIATAVSAIFILGTLIVAYGQLRGLNKATQLQNFIGLAQEADSPEFSKAYMFVTSHIGMNPEKSYASFNEDAKTPSPMVDRVVNFFERIAFLSKQGYLDRTVAIQWFGVLAQEVLQSLGGLVELKQRSDPGTGQALEEFVADAEAYWQRAAGKRRDSNLRT